MGQGAECQPLHVPTILSLDEVEPQSIGKHFRLTHEGNPVSQERSPSTREPGGLPDRMAPHHAQWGRSTEASSRARTQSGAAASERGLPREAQEEDAPSGPHDSRASSRATVCASVVGRKNGRQIFKK